jgi:hypothetical protein
MRARKLLENAALAPAQLTVLYKAFDDAWEAIKPQYATSPQSGEVGRLRLANAILSAYRDGLTGPDALKAAGIKMVRR